MWVSMCAVATTERVTVCSHLVDTPVPAYCCNWCLQERMCRRLLAGLGGGGGWML